MELDRLRDGIAVQQKKGLPFILASVVIWACVTAVSALPLPVMTKNMLVFCCSVPLMPLAMLAAKVLKVDLFSKENPLGQLGFLFTLNQMLYLLIVMWVYRTVPEKTVMVYAMVFGAHLLPYSWLYKSGSYRVFAILIPVLSLLLGCLSSAVAVAAAVTGIEVLFALLLFRELRALGN